MDETLKRRLVGAAVLALIAIVIVPMLLDGPDWQQASDEPAVTTTRNAEGERVVSVSLNGAVPATAPRPRSTARVVDVPAAIRAPTGTGRSEQRTEPVRRMTNAEPAATSSNRNRANDVSRSSSHSAGNSSVAVRQAEPRAAAPGVQGRRAESAASVSRSGWVVQLATFASEENANRLVDKLQAGGWSAWLEPMTSRTGRQLQQVRVGPERSQAQASSAAERLAVQFKLKPQVLDLR